LIWQLAAWRSIHFSELAHLFRDLAASRRADSNLAL
jgi:hypothetical protein